MSWIFFIFFYDEELYRRGFHWLQHCTRYRASELTDVTAPTCASLLTLIALANLSIYCTTTCLFNPSVESGLLRSTTTEPLTALVTADSWRKSADPVQHAITAFLYPLFLRPQSFGRTDLYWYASVLHRARWLWERAYCRSFSRPLRLGEWTGGTKKPPCRTAWGLKSSLIFAIISVYQYDITWY